MCVVISVSRARRASHCRLEKIISTGEVLLTEEGGDLLLQIAGQHGSVNQPVDLTKVKQVTIVCVDHGR